MSSSTVHPGDIAGAGAPPAPGRRSTLRSVALPTEHGGWGLTLEPVLLGLLLRWSGAGLCLGVAAFVAFTARTPLKVVLVDARRRRVLPRTRVAQRVLAAEAMLLSLLVAAALVLEASAFWMPLVVIVPLVLVELWFDMRSRGRRLVPELVGAIGMGGVVAVIVLAGDGSGFDMSKVDLSKSVIVGDPDDMRDVRYSFPALPGARKEAQAIAKELGIAEQNVLIGADATRKNVVRAIDRSAGEGVIYMATHAVADAKNPLTRGFVVLSQQNLFAGELRTQQFRGWDEHEPLVVMSACQTALGRVFDGGTFGVARTWTNAGAGQVVASLWNVSDRATYRLMTRFVAGLQQGKAPELAMQAAQLATIKNYPNDPKMWASFTIIGKPSFDSRAMQQRSGSSL